MGHKFADIAFTDKVREKQELHGSRRAYAALDGGIDHHDRLGAREAAFIAARDSFYIATVSETCWPYIQHRGGPKGFVRILDEKTIGFADFRGNRQYVTTGNLQANDRAALFFMDYPSRSRLKVLGRVRVTTPVAMEPGIDLQDATYRARTERHFRVTVEAFDWNCSQHITPRFTNAEMEDLYL